MKQTKIFTTAKFVLLSGNLHFAHKYQEDKNRYKIKISFFPRYREKNQEANTFFNQWMKYLANFEKGLENLVVVSKQTNHKNLSVRLVTSAF